MADGGRVVVKIDGDTKGFEGKFDKIKSFAGSAAKGIAAGFTAAAAGVGAIGTAAVKAYGEYEQLVGGVETLFGARSTNSLEEYAEAVGKSADKVKAEYEMVLQAQEYVMHSAANAYETAGLSANEYMETATMLAASLNQSSASQLDSANLANMAITDMADNANKMGTSMEMIQNAYQGFSKQNYTMLDNLKLGYGGTKGEMERLLADAQKLSGIKYDVSSLTDIVEAIHVIQTEQGITGTTAKEAATTIQGSLNMTKAAWENLVTALATPDADIGLSEALDDFIYSAKTFAENLLPVITQVLSTLPGAISSLGATIAAELPGLFSSLMPSLIDGATSLIAAITGILPQFTEVLVSALPQFISGVEQIVNGLIAALPTLIQTLAEALPVLIPQLITAVTGMITTIAANLPLIIQPIIDNLPVIVQSIIDGLNANIPALVDAIIQINVALIAMTPQIMLAWVKAIPSIISGICQAIVSAGKQIYITVSGLISEWLSGGVNAIQASGIIDKVKEIFASIQGYIIEALSAAITAIATWGTNLITWAQTAIPQFIESVVTFFSTLPERIGYALGFAIGKLALWGTELYAWATTAIPAFIDSVVTFFRELPGKIKEKFDEIINNTREWGANLLNWAQTAIPQFVNNVISKIKGLPGKIHEQLTKALNKVKAWGNNLKSWAQATIPSIVNSIVTFFKELPGKMLSIGKDIVTGLWNGITGAKDWLIGKVKGFCNNIKKGFQDAFKIGSPSKVMRDEVGRWLAEGIAVGVEKNIDKIVDALSSLTKDTRTEVQKVIDESNKQLLDSEKFYDSEKERLSSDSAKTQEQIAYESEKKRQKYLKKQTDDEKKANDERLEQLKSAADEANENQKKANEKYLANLKETAEKERKLYDAMQKDIANSQNEIVSAIATFAQKAKKSIEDVQKEQESYAKKLQGYVSIYDSSSKTFTDFKPYAEQMRMFADAMTLLKERKDVPAEFFAELRDLPIEQGIAFATGLANAPDTMFETYMDGWKEYRAETERTSKLLYQDEAQNAADEVVTAFEELGTQLDKIGENNAEAWANGFAEKVKAYIPELMNSLFGAYSDISSGGQLAFAAPQGNIYNNSYYVQPSSGESTQQQIWALRNAQFLNEQRGY